MVRSERCWIWCAVLLVSCYRPEVHVAPDERRSASVHGHSPRDASIPESTDPPTERPVPFAVENVRTQWVVRVNVKNDGVRYLLVTGLVPKGSENDPPADADYSVLRQVSEEWVLRAGLPLRSITKPGPRGAGN
jgi:hypothetical protein